MEILFVDMNLCRWLCDSLLLLHFCEHIYRGPWRPAYFTALAAALSDIPDGSSASLHT